MNKYEMIKFIEDEPEYPIVPKEIDELLDEFAKKATKEDIVWLCRLIARDTKDSIIERIRDD